MAEVLDRAARRAEQPETSAVEVLDAARTERYERLNERTET